MYDHEFARLVNLAPFPSWMTSSLIEKECIDGFRHKVRSIIVEPYMVPMLKRIRDRYDNGYTRIGMTLSYPYGGFTTELKIKLMRYAVENGLDECDVGININAVLSDDIERAQKELKEIVKASEGKVRVVAIGWLIRNSLENITKICKMFRECGVSSIKTNPGGHFGDMEVEHIKYIHDHFPEMIIEVAGRCRNRKTAEQMFEAGATSFHLSSWRRMSGIGNDIQFNFDTKLTEYSEYKDRLN